MSCIICAACLVPAAGCQGPFCQHAGEALNATNSGVVHQKAISSPLLQVQVHCENRYKGSMYGQLTASGLHMEYI